MSSQPCGATALADEERLALESLTMQAWNAATRATKGAGPREGQRSALRQLRSMLRDELNLKNFVASHGHAGSPPGPRAVFREPLVELTRDALDRLSPESGRTEIATFEEWLDSLSNETTPRQDSYEELARVLGFLHQGVLSRQRPDSRRSRP